MSVRGAHDTGAERAAARRDHPLMLQSRAHVLAARARVALGSRGGSNENACQALTEDELRSRACDPSLCVALDVWWRTACTWYSPGEGLSFEQYKDIARRVYRATCSGAYSDDEAKQATLMDWTLECGGDHAGRMARDRFVALVYSLGEVWSLSPDPAPLCAFLTKLFETIAEPLDACTPSDSREGLKEGLEPATPGTPGKEASAAPTFLAKGVTGHVWRQMEVCSPTRVHRTAQPAPPTQPLLCMPLAPGAPGAHRWGEPPDVPGCAVFALNASTGIPPLCSRSSSYLASSLPPPRSRCLSLAVPLALRTSSHPCSCSRLWTRSSAPLPQQWPAARSPPEATGRPVRGLPPRCLRVRLHRDRRPAGR